VWTFLRDRGSVPTSRGYRPAGPLGLLWHLCLLFLHASVGVVKGGVGSPPVVSTQRLRVARVVITQTFPSHLREGRYCGAGAYPTRALNPLLGFSCIESRTSRKRTGQPTDMNHGSSTGGTLTTIVDYMDGSFLLPKGQGTVRGPSPYTLGNLKLSPLRAIYRSI
jgi:hypothetical protein